MASPFTIFRKHRKAFIVALTIMTMFGFVFIPMIMDTMQIGRPKDPVMVTTKKYGKLRQSDVFRLVENRRRVAAVLEEALRTAEYSRLVKDPQFRQVVQRRIFAAYADDPETLGAALQPAAVDAAVAAQAVEELQRWVTTVLGKGNEEAVVESWLLARRAEELGIQVSEKQINRFLENIGGKKIADDQWQMLLERQGLIDKQFFALLRNVLLAQQVRVLFGPSLGGVTPGQRWDYFSRLKQEATIEALPVRVADYIDDVDDPDAKTLQAFFERHKNDYDLSTSPTPGFRQHERANVRYFRLVQSQIEKSITTAAVKEYIEKNKDSLERRYEAAHKKPETKKTEEKKTEEKKTEEGRTEEKPAAKEAEGKKTGDKKTEEGKPEEKPEPKGPAKEPEADKTSARSAGTPAQFAAFMQEAPAAEKTPEKTAAKAADEAPAKTAEKTAEEAPAKTEEKPADGGEPPVPGPVEGEGKPGVEKPAGKPKEDPGKEKKPDIDLESLIPEIIPMSKEQWIENAARKELAGQQYRDAVNGLQAAIKAWSAQQRDFEAKTRSKRPDPLNFEALCAKYGATSDETGLRSAEEMSELEIARSRDGGQAFRDLIFSSRSESARVQLSKYQAGVTRYRGGAAKAAFAPLEAVTYVFYKTEDRPEKSVAWEDEGTYDLALAKWKIVQARKLAFEAAEGLAKKARDSEKTLKEIFPDRKVVSAGPFTWMTEGVSARLMGGGEPPTLSQVDGIERPGDDFMRTVFTLAPGSVDVAMNQPETVAYVVRLGKLGRIEESLWAAFEKTPPGEYDSLAGEDIQAMARAWIGQLKADAGLKWEVPPDRPAGATGAEQ